MIYRARSASNKTDDWPFWYITDDMPPDHNKLVSAIARFYGLPLVRLPFVTRGLAETLAMKMNILEDTK